MTSVALAVGSFCASNTHFTLTATVGGTEVPIHLHIDDVRGAPTREELIDALLVVLRYELRGLSRAQIRAKFPGTLEITL